MTTEKNRDPVTLLLRLKRVALEDISKLSDADLIKEAEEEGVKPSELAGQLLNESRLLVAKVRKRRLKARLSRSCFVRV